MAIPDSITRMVTIPQFGITPDPSTDQTALLAPFFAQSVLAIDGQFATVRLEGSVTINTLVSNLYVKSVTGATITTPEEVITVGAGETTSVIGSSKLFTETAAAALFETKTDATAKAATIALTKAGTTELDETTKSNLAAQWPEAAPPHLIDTFQRDSDLTGEIGAPENGVEADYSLWGTQIASARVDNGRFYNADGATSAVHVTYQHACKSMFAKIGFVESPGTQFGQVALLWQEVLSGHGTNMIHAIWTSKTIVIDISDNGVDFGGDHLVLDFSTATLNGRLQEGETLDVGLVIGPETLTVIDPRFPGGSHVIKTDLMSAIDSRDMFPCWEVFDNPSGGLKGVFESISASRDANFRPPWFSRKQFSGPRTSDGLMSVYALGDPEISGNIGQWGTEDQGLTFSGAIWTRAGKESVPSTLLEEVTDDSDNAIFEGGERASTAAHGTNDVLILKIPAPHSGSSPLLVNHGDSLEYTLKAFIYGSGSDQVINFKVDSVTELTITPNARATSFNYEPVDVTINIRKILVGANTKYALTVTGTAKDQDAEMYGDLLNNVEDDLTIEYDCSASNNGFFLIYQANCKRTTSRVVS